MRFVSALACLLLATSACDRILGIQELPHASPDAGGDTAPPPPCMACAIASCNEARVACEGDAVCNALWTCLQACPLDRPACREACEDASSTWSTNAPYLAFQRCSRKLCLPACYGTGGLIAPIDASCACIDTDNACATQRANCVQSGVDDPMQLPGDCERRMNCIATLPNPDNFIACDSNLGGAGPATLLFDCARKSVCSKGACPMPTGELACNDNFHYGQSRAPTQTFTLTVSDGVNNGPLVGAEVTACAPGQCVPCTPVAGGGVQATGTTDPNGKVSLQVPTGFHDYNKGCVWVKSPATGTPLLTTIVFPGRPVDQNEDIVATLLFDRDTITAFGELATPSATPDYTSHGHFIGTVHDCLYGHVVGAKVAIDDPEARVLYLDSSGPAGVDQTKGTTALGAFGIVNVTPGKHVISATLNGATVGTLSVDVLAGALHDANLFPVALP